MIEIVGIKKHFGSQVVLDGIDLSIDKGEMLAIVGPSGTGKSVLLKIITGLLPADAGDVLIDGDSIVRAETGKERRGICSRLGVLFQSAALLDSMSLLENVAFPLRYRFDRRSHESISEREIINRSREALAEVGLYEHQEALPGQVSIGMRKRVGVARALVTRPEVILFDEPNTGLDPEVGQEIYELIIETQKHSGFTGIVVSHEIPEVFQVCSRVVMLYKGKVQIDGTIDEFNRSENAAVRQFRRGEADGPLELNH